MSLPYSAVLFDLDDTLIDFKKSEGISLRNCHKKYFAHLGDFEIFERDYTRINRALWKQVEQGSITTTFLGQERFRQLAVHFGVEPDPEFPRYYEQQLIEHSHLIDGAIDLLEHLKLSQIKIGFLTNGFAHIQHSKYRNLNLARYSDVLVISEEVGVSKPHPYIFQKALEIIGTEASATLMVGDSLESDGKGARNIGMGFCWYNPEDLSHSLGWEPELIIKHLNKLSFQP